jgi:hypothetical protein
MYNTLKEQSGHNEEVGIYSEGSSSMHHQTDYPQANNYNDYNRRISSAEEQKHYETHESRNFHNDYPSYRHQERKPSFHNEKELYSQDPADAAMETHPSRLDYIRGCAIDKYSYPPAPSISARRYNKYIDLFKQIVYQKMCKGLQKFHENYLNDLRTEETFTFKANVIYDEMTIKLEKYKFRSKLAEDLNSAFKAKDIRLNSLNIGCSEKLYEPKLKCLFNDNQEAIEYFIKGFKTADLFPTMDQLHMIIDFHSSNRYKLSICENTVKKYVLSSKNTMVEKQYFVQWMSEVYGLNLASITMSSIIHPGYLDDKSEIMQVKLFSLLCLFYNISPSELMNLQLFSIVYLKPNFCFKSHCGSYLLILPANYSNYLTRLISDVQTCEMKSCSQKIKDDLVRTFCYHNKNKVFKSIE